jgi:hypothetical protein
MKRERVFMAFCSRVAASTDTLLDAERLVLLRVYLVVAMPRWVVSKAFVGMSRIDDNYLANPM